MMIRAYGGPTRKTKTPGNIRMRSGPPPSGGGGDKKGCRLLALALLALGALPVAGVIAGVVELARAVA